MTSRELKCCRRFASLAWNNWPNHAVTLRPFGHTLPILQLWPKMRREIGADRSILIGLNESKLNIAISRLRSLGLLRTIGNWLCVLLLPSASFGLGGGTGQTWIALAQSLFRRLASHHRSHLRRAAPDSPVNVLV